MISFLPFVSFFRLFHSSVCSILFILTKFMFFEKSENAYFCSYYAMFFSGVCFILKYSLLPSANKTVHIISLFIYGKNAHMMKSR